MVVSFHTFFGSLFPKGKNMQKNHVALILLSSFACAGAAFAAPAPITVDMKSVSAEGIGASIGTIEISETAAGLKLIPHLKGLPAGERGFHVHENPDCSAKEKEGKMTAAQAAGGHYDPHHSGHHLGPAGGGHVGDLPKLTVKEDGTATAPIEVTGLQLSDITNRSLMIHAGSDTYSDTPAPLGGGGARIACGIITAK
jgi:Cu-Zn family superoxide dismutase